MIRNDRGELILPRHDCPHRDCHILREDIVEDVLSVHIPYCINIYPGVGEMIRNDRGELILPRHDCPHCDCHILREDIVEEDDMIMDIVNFVPFSDLICDMDVYTDHNCFVCGCDLDLDLSMDLTLNFCNSCLSRVYEDVDD